MNKIMKIAVLTSLDKIHYSISLSYIWTLNHLVWAQQTNSLNRSWKNTLNIAMIYSVQVNFISVIHQQQLACVPTTFIFSAGIHCQNKKRKRRNIIVQWREIKEEKKQTFGRISVQYFVCAAAK